MKKRTWLSRIIVLVALACLASFTPARASDDSGWPGGADSWCRAWCFNYAMEKCGGPAFTIQWCQGSQSLGWCEVVGYCG